MIATLAALGALGCGPGGSASDAGRDAAFVVPDAPRPDAPPPSDAVAFRVVRGVTPAAATPAAGCAVSIVAPGPRRFEGMADDDGAVTLEGFAWGADGRLSATFYSAGHTAFSLSGFSRADYEAGLVGGRFEVFLPVQGAPSEATLRVSGTASGIAGSMDVLYVQPTLLRSAISVGRGAVFEARVPPGEAFRLLVTDLTIARGIDRSLVQTIEHWALTGELGPLAADLVRDVDLDAESVTPTTATASFVMPDAAFFRDVRSEVSVVRTSLAGQVSTGLATLLTVGADERTVDVTMSLVDVPGLADARTVVTVTGPLGTSSSTLPLAAPAGTFDARLLVPPTTDAVAGRPLFQPLGVMGTSPDLETRVRVEDSSGRLLWTVVAPRGTTTVGIPAPPTGTMADLLGAPGSPAYVAAQLCELAPVRTERCTRSASSARVLVAVP